MLGRVIKTLLVLLVHFYTISSVAENIGQLPHCVDNTGQGLLLVSTLDGKLSTLNSTGGLVWQIDTGSLLKSNIHNIELASNGEWLRLIPSLTGGLYKFNGKTIDAIPISADSLLKSSFFYSPDLVIAGGKEVRTYGIGLHSGHLFYTCSLLGCQNETNFEGEIDNVLIIERNTLTIRAHEPRTGNERWNFSVGHHNIRIPSVSCFNTDNMIINFNVTAIIPEGLIITTKLEDENQILWKYKFEAPIVNVWLWDGRELSVIDVFNIPVEENVAKKEVSPAIYLAMHNKQLYIHESVKMLDLIYTNLYTNLEVSKTKSIAKIPWKPIPASSSAIIKTGEQDVAARSVLYSSEYVNGNGYYLLYVKEHPEEKEKLMCTDNVTNAYRDKVPSIKRWLHSMWTYIVLVSITFTTIYLLCGSNAIMVTVQTPTPSSPNSEIIVPFHDEIENNFVSNYESTFETIGCLGRGGFGVVFEVTQKLDKCKYAIKRITLPNSSSVDRVLREVIALATLEHKNIIRYYNSWLEKPPAGWKYKCDKMYPDEDEEEENELEEAEESSYCTKQKHKRNNSTIIDIDDIPNNCNNTASDFEVLFKDSNNSCESISERVNSVRFKEDEERDKRTNKNYLFIQMQLCQKESLRDWLENNRVRDKSTVIGIFRQIVDAVGFIHSHHLIHRDLKPNNIFFSMDNVIKVGDFGLVATTSDNVEDWNKNTALLQNRTKGVGTELYMSPEQLEKCSYDLKVDIYSLGVIFFELLVPFGTGMERHKTLTNLRKHEYPKGFIDKYIDEHRLLEKMISNNPEIRPTTEEIMKTAPFTSAC